MQEKRRECTSLDAENKALRKSSEYHDDHIRTIDAWFTQVSDLYIGYAFVASLFGFLTSDSFLMRLQSWPTGQTLKTHFLLFHPRC